MVLRELLNRVPVNPVDTRVAHVSDGELVVARRDCDDGGTHASMVFARVGGVKDLLVGEVDGAAKSNRSHGEFARIGADNVDIAIPAGLAKILKHTVHRHFAGDFAGGCTAHAVTDDVDAVSLVETVVILVVGAHAADIGLASDFNGQTH